MKRTCSVPNLSEKQIIKASAVLVSLYNSEGDAELEAKEIDEMFWSFLSTKGWVDSLTNPWEWISEWVDRANRMDVDEDIARQLYYDILDEIEAGEPQWTEETEN